MTAKNESGEDTKSLSVVVISDLEKDGELTLLSQGKDVEATSYVNENEAPKYAVDGDIKKNGVQQEQRLMRLSSIWAKKWR